MSHSPTTARDRSADAGADSQDHDSAESTASLIDGLPDLDGEEFPSISATSPAGLEGVRRADITPPSVPLGGDAAELPEEHWEDIDVEGAERSDMTTTLKPAIGSIADMVSLSHDHSEAEDIILCEPPSAHLAMLSLRLPARSPRRSIPSYSKSVAECGAVQQFRPVIPLATSGENGDLVASAASVESAGARARELVLCGAENEEAPMSATTVARPELPPRGEIAKLGIRKNGGAPRRIGSGALVPAKLTWMPKDPFGNGIRKQKSTRFRWEVMLTTACVTAGAAMACLFLLLRVTG